MIETTLNAGFARVLERILAEEEIADKELLPFLAVENLDQRILNNKCLAGAYLASHSPQRRERARTFIRRAWQLGAFSETLFPLYKRVHEQVQDYQAIRAGYKRLGMEAAKQGDAGKAIALFNAWQNCLVNYAGTDDYQYDEDVLDCMERLAMPYKFTSHEAVQTTHGKIHLAYLVKGITDVNSVLVKLTLLYARFHDSSLFDISIVLPETRETIAASAQGQESLALFEEHGCQLILAENISDDLARYVDLGRRIHAAGPHILIAHALLADFFYYFLALQRPAPVVISYVAGSLPLFATRNLDWMISWFAATQIDAPGNCSLVPFELDLPGNVAAYSKESLQIHPEATVLVSAGRSAKFQHPQTWHAIIATLQKYPHVCFAAIGIEKEWVPFLDEIVPPEIESRIKCFGWREDYLRILAAGDICLDTYPTGGGVALADAMALGLPVVSFHHSYEEVYRQTHASGADEFVEIAELIADRDDFERFKEIIGKLIEDESYRQDMSRRCREQIKSTRGNPERMVRRSEEIYVRVLREKMPHLTNSPSGPASPDPAANNEIHLVQVVTPTEIKTGNKGWSVGRFETELLRKENFDAWQTAFEENYDSNMGDHRLQFYADQIAAAGLYDDLVLADRVVEFGPGNGQFTAVNVNLFPHKHYYLVDISRKNIEYLRRKFAAAGNVSCILNDSAELPLHDIDSAFSFLLCQSVPRRLWADHLSEVNRMLQPGGAYVFQFAYHPDGSANDSVPLAVSGSHVYSPEQMSTLAHEAGFRDFGCTQPITLAELQTDIIWYLCRMVK